MFDYQHTLVYSTFHSASHRYKAGPRLKAVCIAILSGIKGNKTTQSITHNQCGAVRSALCTVYFNVFTIVVILWQGAFLSFTYFVLFLPFSPSLSLSFFLILSHCAAIRLFFSVAFPSIVYVPVFSTHIFYFRWAAPAWFSSSNFFLIVNWIVGRYYLGCTVSYKIDAITCIIETYLFIIWFHYVLKTITKR